MTGDNPLDQDFGFPGLLRFALPTMAVMVCMGLYTMADTVFVARFVGEEALSAVDIACPVSNLLVGIAAMLASGGSAIVARKMGEGDYDRARRDFTLVIAAGAVAGTAIGIAGLAFLDRIARALGASEALLPYCRSYLALLFAFAPACILQALFQNLIVAAGRPRMGMALALGAGAVDLALDAILMGPLRMGIAGAALSNGIGYLVPTVAGLAFFSSERSSLRFRKPILDSRVLLECLGNGSSELVGQLAAAVTTFLFNARMMRLLGERGVAAVTIMIFAQFFLSSLFFGFSMGVAPVISFNYGSGNEARLRRLLGCCIRFVAGVSILVYASSLAFGDAIVGLFAPRGRPLHELAAGGFRIFSAGFLFSGLNIFASSAFTALSDGKTSALIAFLRTFGLLATFIMVFPELFGVTGVWLAVPAAEAIAFAVSAACLGRWLRNPARAPGGARA